MPVIQTAGSQRKLQQAYGLLAEPPAPTLSEEIVPVTLVDDLSAQAGSGEPGAPGAGIPPPVQIGDDPLAVQQYEADGYRAAVAGQNGQVGFVNPRGSGVLAMITSITGIASANSSLTPFFSATTILVPTQFGVVRDTRYTDPGSGDAQAGVSVCGLAFTNNVGVPGVNVRPSIKVNPEVGVNTARDVRYLGYILRPNSHVLFTNTVVNNDFHCNLIWVERPLLDGEPDGT